MQTAEEAGKGEQGFIYARLDHPNMVMLQARLAVLDGAEDAAVFNCGMAAINTIMQAFLQPGDAVLHTRPIYGGTDGLLYTHLKKFGITPFGIDDALEADSVRSAARAAMAHGRVGLVMVETPANPTSGIADIALIAGIADEIGAGQGSRPLVCVDNTFLGPFHQNPLAHGADLCMTSLTKYAAGHSDLLAGGVSGKAGSIHVLKQLRTLLAQPSGRAYMLDGAALAGNHASAHRACRAQCARHRRIPARPPGHRLDELYRLPGNRQPRPAGF